MSRNEIIQRRRYFPSIEGNERSLYISSYPIAVEYLSKRIGNPNKSFAELCCGIGVTLMYVGKSFKKITGLDNDPKVLDNCRKNLEHMHLLNKAELIEGDVNDINTLKKIKADIVSYDIPDWDNLNQCPDIRIMIMNIRKWISSDIMTAVPAHYSYEKIVEELGPCEYQKVFINGKYDRNYIYLGNLIQKKGITEIHLNQ